MCKDVEKVGPEFMGPMVGAADAVGPALELDAFKPFEGPGPEVLVISAGAVAVADTLLDTAVAVTRSDTPLHEIASPDTDSFSDSSFSEAPELSTENLAWGKKEEYFRVSLSGEDLARPTGDGGSPVGRAIMDPLSSLESVGSELVGFACMSYTGPNSAMQMVPRRVLGSPELEEVAPRVSEGDDTAERESCSRRG
jgi:hypothetical protein